MGTHLTCSKCGQPFIREKGTNRINCFACRPSRAVPDDDGQPAPVIPMPAAPTGPGDVERAVMRELETLGMADSVEGAMALGLAAHVDRRQKPGHLATLGRGLVQAMEKVQARAKTLEGTPAQPVDPLDELAARARRKRDTAGA